MKKSRGIISLILVAAVIAALGFITVCGLDGKGMGAAKNINLGLDLEGGVSITYQAKGDTPSAEDMKDTVYKMQRRVEQYSTEAQAYQEGDNRVSIEIPGVQDANEILEELEQKPDLQISDIATYDTLYENQGIIDEKKEFEQGKIHCAVFTSASTVKGFVKACPDLDYSKVTAACIGKQTKAAADAWGMKTYMAEKATIDSVLELVQRLENNDMK